MISCLQPTALSTLLLLLPALFCKGLGVEIRLSLGWSEPTLRTLSHSPLLNYLDLLVKVVVVVDSVVQADLKLTT